jgi:4-hydroxybenzoate polyprenyltransferase
MKTRAFLRDIRIEHTLFALPFAYVGALLAQRGLPPWPVLGWITLAVLGARTAAMAANRYFDRDIDARNPRTAGRAVASGALSPAAMLWATAAGLAVLLVSAWMLNPLCVALMPLAALLLLLYPLCKRFTWLAHFVLGAVDALAPVGAYVAVAGRFEWPMVPLFFAITFWVAGFDVVYALMDLPIDVREGLRSLPVRFGERSARLLPIVLHVATAALLAAAGAIAGAGVAFYLGVAAAVGLAVYERSLIARASDVFALNDRIFVSNMAFSVVFLMTTAAAYAGWKAGRT